MTGRPGPPPALLAALGELGVVDPDAPPEMVPLTGGVSSEIWRIDLPAGPVVAKQALAQLRVSGTWRAPQARSRYEVAWMRTAAGIVPGIAPDVIAAPADAPDSDTEPARDSAVANGPELPWTFVMAYLPPARFRLWKTELLAGRAASDVAGAVGGRLGQVHVETAGSPAISREFDNGELFEALRLHPYLGATADAHPDLADVLGDVRAGYLGNRIALVHGDVSPKNILTGPSGPVLLDAECATWGDPAFDVAFCTTHLLLKRVVARAAHADLTGCLDALVTSYDAHIAWEDRAGYWSRCAATACALLLARIDGLSPVEYLDEHQRAAVRAAARGLLSSPPTTMSELSHRWDLALASTDWGR